MANKAPKSIHPEKETNEVDAFMAALEHPLKAEIEALRAIILGADKRIGESIKWNAPSFFIEDHFATLKLWPARNIQVILHTGAKVKSNNKAMEVSDPAGLLKWVASDRCVITFSSLNDIQSGKTPFAAILKQWIKQL